MSSMFHVWMQWGPRAETDASVAQHLRGLVDLLLRTLPAHRSWTAAVKGPDALPLADEASFARAAREGFTPWRTGDRVCRGYVVRAAAGSWIHPRARLSLACGIESTGLRVFTPNRVSIEFEAPGTDDPADRAVFDALLRGVVDLLSPDAGFLGRLGWPAPPLALSGGDRAAVSWMTYLSALHPPLRGELPAPALATTLGARGAVVLSHPVRFDPAFPRHVAALQRVKEHLARAGVLAPVRAV